MRQIYYNIFQKKAMGLKITLFYSKTIY